jgi:hypothetical protein
MALYIASLADSEFGYQSNGKGDGRMRLIEHPSTELWDQVVSRSSYATFFHTSTWSKVIVQTYPHFHIATKGFVLDDGVIAIVPMVGTTERNRYFKRYESVFPGGYGGAVAERDLAPAEIYAIFQHLMDMRTAYIHVMGNPRTDHELPSSFRRSVLSTCVLDLNKGFDAILGGFNKSKKRSIDKARKMGVEIGIAETEAEFRAYYEVYEDTLRRWGDRTLIKYPYRLFEQIYRCNSDGIQLWVARVDGQIASGAINLYMNGHVVGWHAATRESYFRYQPFALLVAEMIRDACQRGFSCFDLGPSGGLKGVETYKRELAPQTKHFYSYRWQDNRLYYAYSKLRHVGRGAPHESPLERNGHSSPVAEVEPGVVDEQTL